MGSMTMPSQRRIVAVGSRGRVTRRSGPDDGRPADHEQGAEQHREVGRETEERHGHQGDRGPRDEHADGDELHHRAGPRRRNSPTSRPRPPSNSRSETAIDTRVNRESPKISSGSMMPSHGPAARPAAMSRRIGRDPDAAGEPLHPHAQHHDGAEAHHHVVAHAPKGSGRK